MRSHTPQSSTPPLPRRFGFIALLLTLLSGVSHVEAGHGVNPFGTGSSPGWGNMTFVSPHVGRTYRTIAPAADPDANPDALRDTTNPETLLLGLNLSAFHVAHPMFAPGIGLGFYRDDGAFSVDLVPKIGTLLGAMGLGVGLTLRDGEPGIVAEGWCAIFAGLRLRRTWIGETDRTSLSLFVAVPMRL